MMTAEQIRYHLPHGDPMVLIDRVTSFFHLTQIQTETDFQPEHWVFKGHFRRHPLVPGFLAVEAMGQAACLLVNISIGQAGDDAVCYLMNARSIKFRRRILPGDTLTLSVDLIRQRKDIYTFTGTAWVGGEKAIEATFTAKMVVDNPVEKKGESNHGPPQIS